MGGNKSVPDELLRARAKWRWTGAQRPPWAEVPEPGRVSVWDFPRPPAIDACPAEVRVELGRETVARSSRAIRVLETASPPTVYLPPEDVRPGCLLKSGASSVCEWKGHATHFDLVISGRLARDAAWCYADPFPEFLSIRGWLAFHPARVDRCLVGGDEVRSQPGGYYGGWITPELVGPWKGEPGTESW